MSNLLKSFEAIQLELRDTITSLGTSEVIAASSRNGDVRLLLRTFNETKWLRIVDSFLTAEAKLKKKPFYTFIGRKYFLHGPDQGPKTLHSAWMFLVEADDPKNLDSVSLTVRTLLEKALVIANAADVEEKARPDEVIEVNLPFRKSKFKDLQERRTGRAGTDGLDKNRPTAELSASGVGGPAAVTNSMPAWDANV
jgi:hypothetical protein